MKKRLTEIMAPVSNRGMLYAAIHNGADSVYIGMPGFNARGRADEISLGDLKEFIKTAHIYGVKIYIAFNVLIYDEEFKNALDLFLQVNDLGPDAWIVQDVGLALRMKALVPEIHLHASTQMTVVNHNDILFYSDLHIKRFTLARELSVSEVEAIRKQVTDELEVFIHGSLCIAYSGQCFTSSGFGGRSANRGECAQSCRHDYELFIDGQKKYTEGDYLVSPRDLMGYEQAKHLSEIGIDALKIEGRLKSPEYVAAAVALYRSVLYANRGPSHETNHADQAKLTAAKVMFNRSAQPGWLDGVIYSDLVDDTLNSHTGLYLGRVHSVKPGQFITVQLRDKTSAEIHKGDGILVAGTHEEYGSSIYEVKIYDKDRAAFAELALANDFAFLKVKNGMQVYLTSSPIIERELTKSYTDKSQFKRIPIDIELNANLGEKIRLTISENQYAVVRHEVNVFSDGILEKAQKQPSNEDLIREELCALSGTPFKVQKISLNIDTNGFFPNKVLKELRREATEKLTEARSALPGTHHLKSSGSRIYSDKPRHEVYYNEIHDEVSRKNNLHVLVRNLDQAAAVISLESGIIDTVYLDFTYGYEYAEAVLQVKNKGIKCGIATARIYKPGEEKQIQNIVSLKPDVILARNATALNFLLNILPDSRIQIVGDFSLNIANGPSAEYFLNKGLKRITSSYDLIQDFGKEQDIDRLLHFLREAPAQRIEVNVSYYLPSFYMEYCLFSKYLGNGMDAASCGHPCKLHSLTLKDRKGEVHPVIADRNCRNTMFNGREKNLTGEKSRQIERLIKSGVKNFRIELDPSSKNIQNELASIRNIANHLR